MEVVSCGVPELHPYLRERRVANQDRRMPAEERKPSAYHAWGWRPSLGDRCSVFANLARGPLVV